MTFTWAALAVISVILLIANWRKSVVWGGFTLGIVVSLIASIFVGFDWVFIAKGGIVGVICGQILNFIPTENKVS